MAAQTDSNGLLKFMNTATSNIQVALGRPTKTKKVNHQKYLAKRLQKGPKTTKKAPKTPPTLHNGRQPVAGLTSPPLSAQLYTESAKQEYDQLYQLVTQPCIFPATTSTQKPINTFAQYSRPPSVHEELESLLSEFGVESPNSQSSLYGDSSLAGSSRGSLVSNMCSSTQLSMENVVTSNDYILSSPSDFSDFDESNYSSPRNPSPVNNIYYSHVSPPPSQPSPGTYYHHNLTASYDCIPTGSSLAVAFDRPNGLSLPYNPSITELIAEVISTP